MEVSSDNNDEEDDNNKGAGSPEESCINPYYNCSCHKNKGHPAPPAPPAMGGYYGEDATQFVGELLGVAGICLLLL